MHVEQFSLWGHWLIALYFVFRHVSANVDTAKDKAIKYSGTNGSSTTDSGRSKKADTSGSRPGKDGGEEATSAPPPLRTSSRVPKRPRRDNTPPPSPPKKTGNSRNEIISVINLKNQ